MSAWPGSSEASVIVTCDTNGSYVKRSTSRTGNQSAGRISLNLAEGGIRPNSTGIQQGQARSPTSLTVDTLEEDGFPIRTNHSGNPGHARDSPLRSSKDGSRPASRPNAALQSPYLQPPSGRASQNFVHRPSSRQQSQPSPQPPSATGQPNPAPPAPEAADGPPPNVFRRPTTGSNGSISSPANGTRIFQAYATPPQRALHSLATTGAPHPGVQQSPKPPPPSSPSPQQQQQQSRAAVAQQQQQQAGPRATTALSGARSMQRATGTGCPFDVSHTASPQGAAGRLVTAPASSPAVVPRPGSGSGTAASHVLHPHYVGPAGGVSGGPMSRNSDAVTTTFSYDDIPEEEDASISPVTAQPFSGLTLEQYMQRMVTTPASAAATSGLGVSADSEESAPCSPGNASTRTEEDSPYNSPAAPKASTPVLGRVSDATTWRSATAATVAAVQASGSMAIGGGIPRLNTAVRASAAAVVAAAAAVTAAATAAAARSAMSSGVALQRVGNGGGGGSTIITAAGPVPPPPPPAATGSFGVRTSATNPTAQGRGQASYAGGPVRSGGGGALTANPSCMYDHDTYSGSGSGADISALLDGGSSDDDPLNPMALLDSPRNSRRLSSRASAMAFSNSLDLRPATAAVVSSSSSMTGGDPASTRSMAIAADPGNHHAIIKQVDLGGLSASLFTPNPSCGRDTSGSPASTANNPADHFMCSNPPSPEMAPGRTDRRITATSTTAGGGVSGCATGAGPSMCRPMGTSNGDHAHVSNAFMICQQSAVSSGGAGFSGSGVGFQKGLVSPKTSITAIPPPWGVSARGGVFGGGQAGEGAGGVGSLQSLASRPLSSRGRPGAVVVATPVGSGDSVAVSPGAGAGATVATGTARPPSSVRWAKPQPQQQMKSDTSVGPPVLELPPEARLLAAQAQGLARPPTRQVQSARPPGSRGEIELDPSVWQANIAMQLQRPPSRQKPPPEALHLWTPEQQRGMLASGTALGRPGGGPRSRGARPHSAAPATYRGSQPSWGPSVKAQGPVGEDMACTCTRPPSRQKPPPLSTLLEHDDFPPPPRRQRPGMEMMDVVVSCSSDEEDDDDDELG